MGVPFNNLRNTTSEKWAEEQFAAGRPGSPCPKKYLVSNTEFTQRPICTASCTYQGKRIRRIASGPGSEDENKRLTATVLEKACLCEHLANPALMALGIAEPASIPTVVCPGPNLAWFNRRYTLREMIDHIYGRGDSLVSSRRPHMLAQEFILSVDQFEQLAAGFDGNPAEFKRLESYKDNLEKEASGCEKIAAATPCPGENLESIMPCLGLQLKRLQRLWRDVLARDKVRHIDALKTAATPAVSFPPPPAACA
jgi:hypothetical protein